ncbi:hypothetical protein [Ktedonospora formicarum]|uniref:DUF1772 domain-containing protein n=1 Tax=Ktedonospora formicarum TaxID=2778364 RepID=A0A8J3MU38_9CHLR|nr:hypothetical protein [Ktedonospora formicarum]GHO46228.1 hypothetical protein KSX_43910 [Ktedonospora formicarum]
MTQTLAEILILVPSVLTTGYLIWIADVLQSIMNDMDEPTFGRFMHLLYKRGISSAYAIVSSTITMIAMIPYFIFYGFNHWWFIAGLFAFILSSVAGKLLNLPVYKRILALDNGAITALAEERWKLQTANWVRSLICLASIVLMVVQFI